MNNDTLNHWYALYTKARAEKKVQEALIEKGIEVYLPLRKELKYWSDRRRWIETPIINSYVFVCIPKTDILRVLELKGVVAFVSSRRKPVVIPDREIEAMRQAVASNLSLNVEPRTVKKGQTITITSGPLKGISGEVVEMRGAKKFYLRISHIGYMLVINLNDETKIETNEEASEEVIGEGLCEAKDEAALEINNISEQ